MSAINLDELREELKDPEMSEGYAESFLDSYIATQIKVLREQNSMSQDGLAKLLGTKQNAISRIENVNYSKWNVSTLKKLARAFRVRLKISFETYGSLLAEVEAISRDGLQRTPRENDPLLTCPQPSIKRVFLHPVSYVHHSHSATSKLRPQIVVHHYHNSAGELQKSLFGGMPTTGRMVDLNFGIEQKPPASSVRELVMGAPG